MQKRKISKCSRNFCKKKLLIFSSLLSELCGLVNRETKENSGHPWANFIVLRYWTFSPAILLKWLTCIWKEGLSNKGELHCCLNYIQKIACSVWILRLEKSGTSLMAQWLRLYTSKRAEGMGLIPGQEIQILYVTQCRKTEKLQTKDSLQSNFNM